MAEMALRESTSKKVGSNNLMKFKCLVWVCKALPADTLAKICFISALLKIKQGRAWDILQAGHFQEELPDLNLESTESSFREEARHMMYALGGEGAVGNPKEY